MRITQLINVWRGICEWNKLCCCVGLWSTSGFVGEDTLYSGTQGLPIWLVDDSCQCWWLYQTEQHHFKSLPGKRLWWLQHVSILSAFFLCAKGSCFFWKKSYFLKFGRRRPCGPREHSAPTSRTEEEEAGLKRCNSLVTVEKLSFILSLCYYFLVSITCHGNGWNTTLLRFTTHLADGIINFLPSSLPPPKSLSILAGRSWDMEILLRSKSTCFDL